MVLVTTINEIYVFFFIYVFAKIMPLLFYSFNDTPSKQNKIMKKKLTLKPHFGPVALGGSFSLRFTICVVLILWVLLTIFGKLGKKPGNIFFYEAKYFLFI